jgi:uncharacterized protein YndB with AHSA1/START domain
MDTGMEKMESGTEGVKDFTIERFFKAPREKVFEAWTDPKQIAQWWSPFSKVDVKVHEMHAAKNGEAHLTVYPPGGGKALDFFLTYKTIDPPREITFTVKDSKEGQESPVMKVAFAKNGAETQMSFASPAIPADRYDDATSGWKLIFQNLKQYLSS